MAILGPIENKEAYDEWVASRPKVIREMIEKCPINRLYRIGHNGNRATIHAYHEDGTVTVDVTGQFNRVLFGRRVFGVAIDQLEECELPDPAEDVGDTTAEAGYDEKDIKTILIPKMLEDHLGRCKAPTCGHFAHKAGLPKGSES